MPYITTNSGLQGYVEEQVLIRYVCPGVQAADLGSGPGAMATRLDALGFDVLALDRDANILEAGLPLRTMDLNQPDFASQIRLHSFGVVTAIKVIEHVESPIGFLRNIGNLLAPGGVGIITTPNVDCLPARFNVASMLCGESMIGDNHVLVLENAS